MNHELIEKLAKEAGDDWDHTLPEDREFLERFARLVAAWQREQDAKILEKHGWLLQAADVIRNSES